MGLDMSPLRCLADVSVSFASIALLMTGALLCTKLVLSRLGSQETLAYLSSPRTRAHEDSLAPDFRPCYPGVFPGQPAQCEDRS